MADVRQKLLTQTPCAGTGVVLKRSLPRADGQEERHVGVSWVDTLDDGALNRALRHVVTTSSLPTCA